MTICFFGYKSIERFSLRQLSISRLKQGDLHGWTIYANDSRVLLGRGIAFTPSYIKSLRELGISIVYVDDEETKDIVIDGFRLSNCRKLPHRLST